MTQRRPLLSLFTIFALGLCLGRFTEQNVPELLWLIVAIAALFAGGIGLALELRGLLSARLLGRLGLIFALFFYAAFAYAHARLPVNFLQPQLIDLGAVRGVVVSYPTVRADRTSFVLKPDGAPGYFQVFYYHPNESDFAPVAYGDLLILRAAVQVPPIFSGFDYREYLRQRDIWGVISVRNERQIQKLANSQGNFILEVGFRWRVYLFKLIDTYVPAESAGLLKGLIFGDTASLSKDVESDFRDAGVLHVLAVSGANLGMILVIFWALLRSFHLSYLRIYLIATPIVLLYWLIVGFEVSLVRASLIFFFVTLGIVCAERGWILKRWSDPIQGLCAAGLLLLVFNPESLFDVSFQLSFAATGAILLAVSYVWPRLEKRLTPKNLPPTEASLSLPWRWRLARWLALFLLVSIAAQTGVAPILAYHFHRLSGPVSLLANLTIVPLVTLALWGGIILLILGALHLGPIAVGLGVMEGWLLEALIRLADLFASLPGAFWQL
ncbi:ComEC/Rec2 family competence protein [Candidatus Acetothermia bacterium]|nr:ComEC/Rec2 family competence protein [Candidatus Acetothermia bacterium]